MTAVEIVFVISAINGVQVSKDALKYPAAAQLTILVVNVTHSKLELIGVLPLMIAIIFLHFVQIFTNMIAQLVYVSALLVNLGVQQVIPVLQFQLVASVAIIAENAQLSELEPHGVI